MASPIHRRALSTLSAAAPKRSSSLFVWTIVILLLIGLAFASWIGSFYIFGHPEKAFSHTVLTRLGKLDPPMRFELTAAPRGEFLTPAKLFEKYGGMTPSELQAASDGLLRDYIRNYKLAPMLVPYVVGDFSILDSYELQPAQFIGTGVVVLAEGKDEPRVLLEHAFPSDMKVVPVLQRMLLTGMDLQLKRGIDLSAVIHVRRLEDGRLQCTAVPLLYGSYATLSGSGTFSLDPPETLQVAAGLPILGPKVVDEATGKKLARASLADGAAPRAQPVHQLVRVERPEPVKPMPPTPTPTPAPVVAEVLPSPTPAPTPEAPPTPSPTPATVASVAGGAWPTYEAGRMPRGRLLNLQDMPELSERGVAGERIYLQGSFVVTASGSNRAVLRSQAALGENLGFRGDKSKMRVIVEFPAGVRPPSEGSAFSRDSMRPFQITDIRAGNDGQINVFVREVTR